MSDPEHESHTPPPAPPAAPPTTPGARPPARPTSKLAIASMVTGVVGLLVPPSAIAGLVLGILALRRLARDRGRDRGHDGGQDGGQDRTRELQGKGLAIAGICTGGAGMLLGVIWVMTTVMMFTTVQNAHSMQALMMLGQVRGEAVEYAARNGDAYPDHVARLIPGAQGISASLFAIRRSDMPVDLRVGAYDVADYDGTPEADAALAAALDALDRPAPTYRFGHLRFVRLARPTGDPDIVFGWVHDPRTDYLGIATDDGTLRQVDRSGWSEVWEADAVARQARGLPAIEAPPVPAESGTAGG